jgi:type II secretory pathway predicted ATPase ExeA
MYESHFGLRERPFRATPDCGSYYAATSHERALARLLQALADDEGMVLLTGEPGTGKTLLCHCLLERLGPDVLSAFLTNSHLTDRASLLQALLYDLSLPYEGRSEQELRLGLTDFLLRTYTAGQRTVLVLDEAQHLGVGLLEELRLLANLEGRRSRAVQVVLAAQPELLSALQQPPLRAIAQRLSVRARLEPLGDEEAADYLCHHLRVVGGRPEAILGDEALEILIRGTGGVPRLLNQAAHQALTLAFQAGAAQVDAEAALEALTLLGCAAPEASEETGTLSMEAPTEGRGLEESGPLFALEDVEPKAVGEGEGSAKEDGNCRLFAAPRRPA